MSDPLSRLAPGSQLTLILEGMAPSRVTLVQRRRAALTLEPVVGAARDTAAIMALSCGQRAEGLASQIGPQRALFRLTDRPIASPPSARDRPARLDADGTAILCHRADGTQIAGILTDVSSSGFGARMEKLLGRGDIVTVGALRAQAVRMTADGYGFQLLFGLNGLGPQAVLEALCQDPLDDRRQRLGLAPRRVSFAKPE